MAAGKHENVINDADSTVGCRCIKDAKHQTSTLHHCESTNVLVKHSTTCSQNDLVPVSAPLWHLLDILQVLQQCMCSPSSCRCSPTAGSARSGPAAMSNWCQTRSCLATNTVRSSLTGLGQQALVAAYLYRLVAWLQKPFETCLLPVSSVNCNFCGSEATVVSFQDLQDIEQERLSLQVRMLTSWLAGTDAHLSFANIFPGGAAQPT